MKKLITIAFLFLSIAAFTQVKEGEEYGIRTDTLKSKPLDLIAVPLAFYTPETEFGFGAGGQLFFNNNTGIENPQISNVFATIIYTTRRQLIIQAKTKTFLKEDKFVLDGNFKFQIFPNLFWGIGFDTPDSAEENYNQDVIELELSFLKRIENVINFGFQFSYNQYNVTEVEEGSQLESGLIPGSEGARLIGLGVVLNVDRRDNYFSPLEGGFYQFKTHLTSKAMGSTYSYNTFFLDMRKYLGLGKNRVLAGQFYSRLNFGEVPFQGLSWYGGGETARGYFRGRYMDHLMYVVQVEYRQPVLKRWEIAAFALTGNVAGPGESLFSDFKSSFGFGPRFFISKDNRAMLRLDYAINSEGGSGIYFGVNEAF